jgi:hypothetical protein
MGYYVQSVSSKFTFKPDTDFDKVLQHVKDTMFTDEALLKKARGGSSATEGRAVEEYTWYSWTDTKACRNAMDIYEIIEQFFSGDIHHSDDGMGFDVWVDNKIGQEDILLDALTPFLVDGSHLYYRGEDGSHFGWRVEGGVLRDVLATITWN